MRWQYKRVALEMTDVKAEGFDRGLDLIGEEGWELIAVVQNERHGNSHEVHLIFKRARDDVQQA